MIRVFVVVLISACVWPVATLAQTKVEALPILIGYSPQTSKLGTASQTRPETPPILIRPAAEPRPALKYRLVPERSSLVAGNAATYYYRAVLMAEQTKVNLAAQLKSNPGSFELPSDMEVYEWVIGPIADIPRDKAKTYLQYYQSAIKEAELGAKCLDCDWQFDHRAEAYNLLLPEIQNTRQIARLLAIQARLDMLDGQLDRAMQRIQTGLTLGRHVNQGPIVIQSLVGVAIDFEILRSLQMLIQLPGAPNLYWAIVDRPRPMIDMRASFDGERHVLEREFPALLELDRGIWGLDQTRKFADDLQSRLFPLVQGEAVPGSRAKIPGGIPDTLRQLGIAAMCAKVYPEARQALKAQGRSDTDIDAMPVVQASMLYCFQEYQISSDNMYKWLSLPYWQSYAQTGSRAFNMSVERKLDNPLLAMFSMLSPSLHPARMASLRLDRQLDAYACIEAIRLYAASHDGKLPESLEAITEVPIPLDPATGKSFAYKLEGDTATLSGPIIPDGPNHPAYAILLVLKLVH